MWFATQCPSCGQPGRVPDHIAGHLIACPKCQATFPAEALAPAKQPVAAPTARPSEQRRQHAFRRYATELGPVLRQRYGDQSSYPIDDVAFLILHHGLQSEYDNYALSMFCSQEEFDSYHAVTGEIHDYVHLREEVAKALYGGNMNFNVTTPLANDVPVKVLVNATWDDLPD